MRHVISVMISCETRSRTRSETLRQLDKQSVPVEVFTSPECETGPSNRENGVRALEWGIERARQSKSTHVLFLEDDLDIASNFEETLLESANRKHVTYLYITDTRGRRGMHLYGDNIWYLISRTQIPIHAEYIRAAPDKYGTLLGSQAILMPIKAAKLALEVMRSPPNPDFASDSAFVAAWAKHNIDARVRIPHVVQHRHDRSGREPDPLGTIKRSLSFGRE